MADNGIICCIPFYNRRGILNIDVNAHTITELDANLLPRRGYHMWRSCALTLDGFINSMLAAARRNMKLDPHNKMQCQEVLDMTWEVKGGSTMKGFSVLTGCVRKSNLFLSRNILKYGPINDITSFFVDLGEIGKSTSTKNEADDACIFHEGRDSFIQQN